MSHYDATEEPEFTLKFNRYGTTPDGWIMGSLRLEQGVHNLAWWPTMERGHGHVSLREGEYIMEHSIKHKHRHIKCLRPIEGAISSILIHDAYKDDPGSLEGCIAPGMSDTLNSWYDSAEAMEQLWKCVGGWQKHKRVKLVVLSNAPGIKGTKDTWARLHAGTHA
jgi:hypothetical protein